MGYCYYWAEMGVKAHVELNLEHEGLPWVQQQLKKDQGKWGLAAEWVTESGDMETDEILCAFFTSVLMGKTDLQETQVLKHMRKFGTISGRGSG